MTFAVEVYARGPLSASDSSVEVRARYGHVMVYTATAPASLLAEVMQLAGAAMLRYATAGRLP